MTEFTVYTTTGPMKITSGSYEEACNLAEQDGHRLAVVYEIVIHLADNEWGSELMGKVAKEAYDNPKYFDKTPLIVTVYEHAGWRLSYTYFAGKEGLSVIGSANGQAVYDDATNRFREAIFHATWKTIETIRRGE